MSAPFNVPGLGRALIRGMTIRGMRIDGARIALTALVGLGCGFGLSRLGAPAPYMLGSLFGAWGLGALVPQAQTYLGTPRWFHKFIVLGLSTLIGGALSIDVLRQALGWWPTVLAMMASTLIATLLALIYLRGIRQQPMAQALLSALPGGQADIVAVAHEYTDRDHLVALVHLCRVVSVFVSMPLLLAFVSGPQGVQDSYLAQANLPSLFDQSWQVPFHLIAVGLVGFLIGRALKIPMPHLLGPLILSMALHLAGVIDIPRLGEFVLVAQLFIAGSIGARLSRVPLREVAVGLADGVVTAILLIGSYILVAFLCSQILGIDLMEMILAFIPGGLYEVTLLALIFGFDAALAFIAFHHTLRIFLIFFSLPWLMDWAKRFYSNSHKS